jgi:polysaccharide export outer membrane protein
VRFEHARRAARCWYAAALLTAALLGSGCETGHVYQVATLPRELAAPPLLDLEAIDLSSMADQSVSVDVIQPGDVLEISIVTDFAKLATTTTPVRVGDDGSVVVPLVGRIMVGGLTVVQAEQTANAESVNRGVFRTPSITVTMKQCHTSKVTVVGSVKTPGPVDLPRGSTSLMAAIVAAGGLNKDAGLDVEIRHTDSRQAAQAGWPPAGLPTADALPVAYQFTPETIKVNLAAAAAGAIKVPPLRDGDVVHVSKRTLPPVYVIGLVRKPDEFPYPPDHQLRVLDALAMAGGVSSPVAEDVLVIRRVPGAAEPVRIAVGIQAAKNGRDNLVLAPGDTVSVEQTTATVFVDTLQAFFHGFSFGATVW